MFKLLIVDDEKIIREGLKSNIDWEANQIEVVGEAEDGEDALRMIKELRPDIVMTDIRMPVLSGLELAELLQKDFPQIKVIILTVIDSFSEIKRSMQADVIDYILKFNYKREALPAVRKACSILERERRIQSRVLSQGRLLQSLIGGIPLAQLQEKIEESFYPGFAETPLTILILADKYGYQVSEEEYFSVQKNVDSAGISKIKTYLTEPGESFCMILSYCCTDMELMLCLRQIMEDITAEWELKGKIIYGGLGGLKNGLQAIQESYYEAQSALGIATVSDRSFCCFSQLDENERSHLILVQKAAQYIWNHYCDRDLCLETIAKQVYLSPPYFCTLFKKYMKTGINDYITVIRIQKARELLERTDLKIYEVAERTGFSSPQYMSLIFKRYLGKSPGEFRI